MKICNLFNDFFSQKIIITHYKKKVNFVTHTTSEKKMAENSYGNKLNE